MSEMINKAKETGKEVTENIKDIAQDIKHAVIDQRDDTLETIEVQEAKAQAKITREERQVENDTENKD